jgi:hypothetical protein
MVFTEIFRKKDWRVVRHELWDGCTIEQQLKALGIPILFSIAYIYTMSVLIHNSKWNIFDLKQLVSVMTKQFELVITCQTTPTIHIPISPVPVILITNIPWRVDFMSMGVTRTIQGRVDIRWRWKVCWSWLITRLFTTPSGYVYGFSNDSTTRHVISCPAQSWLYD